MEYPDYVVDVDCEPIALLEDVEARYYLTVTLDNEYEDMMTYIMMNPSAADKINSDPTVNKVIDFAYKQTNKQASIVPYIGKICVVNLFGLYKTDSAELQPTLDIVKVNSNLYNQMLMENRNKINEFISKSKYNVLAWGDVPSGMKAKTHNEEVFKVFDSLISNQKLDSVYVLNSSSEHHYTVLTDRKRPRHPNRIMPNEYVKCKNMFVKRKFPYVELEE